MTTDSEGDEKEPPPRPSALQLLGDPQAYPDDGPIAGTLRTVDRYAGLLEQAALFAILAAVVITGTAQAVSTKLFQHSLLWSFDIVRGGTFAIAMVGAAFASHQASHLSMDIVSRFVNPRTRQIMRIVLSAFAILATMT